MAALDMSSTYTVKIIVAAKVVQSFDHLHKTVALDKAKTNVGSWIPFDGMLYKVTTCLVLDDTGNIVEEYSAKAEQPREAMKEEENTHMEYSGKALQQKREQALLTQDELANVLSVHPQTISNWETGYRKPAKRYLRMLRDYFESLKSTSTFQSI
jgi:DNA-binding transcriptional regulator YiaG